MGDNRDYVWEYVLVFLFNCCLNWLEMCVVKDFFWFDEEMVMQFYLVCLDYCDCYFYCLYLWCFLIVMIFLLLGDLVGLVGLI